MLDPKLSTRLVMWNRAMAVFHSVFVILTFATADMGMALPLMRPEFSVAAPPDGDGDGYRAWATATTLVPDTHKLYISWIAAAFSALSATFHLLNADVWRTWYLAGIEDCRCPSRWIEYSLSAPLMAVTIGYLTGSTTTDAIVAIFGLISTTMFFGHLCETVARPAGELTWKVPAAERLRPHFLGYVPFVVALAIILQGFARASSFTATIDTGSGEEEIGMPSFVYAIVVTQVLLFSSFTVVQLVFTLRPPVDYVNYSEICYMILSLAAKGILSLLLLTNVIALSVFGAGQ